MPVPRRKIVLEWGAQEHRHVLERAHGDWVAKQVPYFGKMFVLMNKDYFRPRMKGYLQQMAGWHTPSANAGLLQADFLKNPIREGSVDELHAHFMFSAPIPGKEDFEHTQKGTLKRYVDVRESNDFSNAEKMLVEASRILRCGGRLFVTDSEVFLPVGLLSKIAKANGLKLVRLTRDSSEISKYTTVLVGGMMPRQEDVERLRKKSFLAEFKKV